MFLVADVFARRLGNLAAVLALLVIFFMQVNSLSESQYYGPASLVEESAYTYTSANNYLKYGFINSGLLQDFSSSPFPEDHPFVYSHMPPGPDLFVAILLFMTNHSYWATRFIFVLIFVVGFWCYIRFAELLLQQMGLTGGGFTVVFFWPWILVQGMDRFIYSPFPLLAFGPILMLHRYHITGRKSILAFVAISSFLASIYLEYSTLTCVVVSWFLLFFLGLLPFNRKEVAWLIAPAIGGVVLHLIQNALFLGPAIFFEELIVVLGNRITGYPSQGSLKDWYLQLGIVHHGSHPVDLTVLWGQVRENFHFFAGSLVWFAALLSLLLSVFVRYLGPRELLISFYESHGQSLVFLKRLIVWAAASILTPIAFFPAFAQEVSLKGFGGNTYFLAIVAVALTGFAVSRVYRLIAPEESVFEFSFSMMPNTLRIRWKDSLGGIMKFTPPSLPQGDAVKRTVTIIIGVLVVCVLASAAKRIVDQRLSEYKDVYATYAQDNISKLEDLRKFFGHLFMTNINVPAVGFFTGAPGFGVCGPDSVSVNGGINVGDCKVSFMRRHRHWLSQEPKYFVFLKDNKFFPGFAECFPGNDCFQQLESKLASNFSLEFENELFKVFDLKKTASLVGR